MRCIIFRLLGVREHWAKVQARVRPAFHAPDRERINAWFRDLPKQRTLIMHTPSPDRAVAVAYSATSPIRRNALRLLVLGSVLVCLGGLGDIAYHVAPSTQSLEPWLGAQGIRAHILTLAGMLAALAGVFGRGLSR